MLILIVNVNHLSEPQVDRQRHVIAEARTAPGGEAPDAHFREARQPGPGEEDVVDVVGRPVFLAVAPVVGGRALGALTAQGVED